jgi:hypothetical protein
MPATTQARFALKRWSSWRPAAPGAKAEIPEVPPLLRRRASSADRAALRVAFDCAGPNDLNPTRQRPAIFCSRHGEVHRSVELLEQLSKGEALSPMTFSLSVHNSAAALYSLTLGDTSPMSAIAAGRDSLHQGLLEAFALLQDGSGSVLVVAYDDALPEVFKPYRDDDDLPCALALLLEREAPESPCYHLELLPGSEAPLPEPQASQVARSLEKNLSQWEVSSAPRRWLWRKV